ncbi:MAG: helicase HerA-like domain-containing protein, partial [Dichotomicrobium sp.]
PPSSRLGPITESEREAIIAESPLAGRYDETLDRESAYEMLKERAKRRAEARESGETGGESDYDRAGEFRIPKRPGSGKETKRTSSSSGRQGPVEAFLKSFLRSLGTVLPRLLEKMLGRRLR